MPDDVLYNRWDANSWQTEPGEEAAVTQAAYGPIWGDDAWAGADDVPEATTDPPVPSAQERYETLLADWPDRVPVVISADKHISKGNQDAHDYWAEHWRVTRKDGTLSTMQCFDYARYQMHVAGYDTGGYKPDSTTYQAYRRDTGVNLDRTVEGVAYVREALKQRLPVLVGVWLIEYEPNKVFNPDKTTNHYVVIVGMGKDEAGGYFSYYDSLASGLFKFYLGENLELRQADPNYSMIAQIRQTVR